MTFFWAAVLAAQMQACTINEPCGVPGGMTAGVVPSAAETCLDWGMRDFEEAQAEHFTVADPFSRGDVDFAWAGWFQLESLPGAGDYGIILAQRTGGGNRGLQILVQPNNDGGCASCLNFKIGENGGGWVCDVTASTKGALIAATSYFFYAKFDEGDNKCYISVDDGVLDEAAQTDPPADSTGVFAVGALNDASLPHDGKMGPLYRFTTLPTSGEVTGLFNAAFRVKCADVSAGVMSHCWMMDEANGNMLESAVTGNGVNLLDVNTVGADDACIP